MAKSTAWRNGYSVGKSGGQPCDIPTSIYEGSTYIVGDWMAGFHVGARDRREDEIIDAFQEAQAAERAENGL